MWCAVRIPIDRSLRLLLIGLGLLGPLTADDVCASIRTLVRAEAKKQDIPAISVAIVQNNQIACSVAPGWPEEPTPSGIAFEACNCRADDEADGRRETCARRFHSQTYARAA